MNEHVIKQTAANLAAIKPGTQITVDAKDYESLVLAVQLAEMTLETTTVALEAMRTTLAQVRR